MLGRKIVAIGVLLIVPALATAKDLAVVSHRANTIQEMSVADLTKVCKGQTSHWPDGKPVTFVMMPPSTPEMKTVVQKIYEAPPTTREKVIRLSSS